MSGVELYVGTSGYSYEHWKQGVFYPPGLKNSQMLEYYLQYFNAVELNVTFYRTPDEDVFKSWYKRTPADFRFVVKGPRVITHLKKLNDCAASLKIFMDRAANLKEKLILILWQFPARFKYDESKLFGFLKELNKGKAKKFLHAFEFRDAGWFNNKVSSMLKKYNFCFCFADSPSWPGSKEITADYLYLRFHGGKILYGSEYSAQELKEWVKRVRSWVDNYQINKIFAFFNNDSYGFAVKNALSFKKLLVEY